MATGPFNKSTLNNMYSSCDFPVHRRELIEKARNNDMSPPFMKALQQLPKRDYSDVDDIHNELNTGGRSRARA